MSEPRYELIKNEGAHAYIDGLAWDQNPYPKGSKEYDAWSKGWHLYARSTELRAELAGANS